MSFARDATAPRASSLSCTRRGSAGARRELNTTTAQKQNPRDGHDGNAKCQCCTQAKRQHVEVLRGMGGPVCTLGQNHWGNWRRQDHRRKPLSAGSVMGAGKERYRLLAGRTTWKTTPGQNRFKKQNSYENVRKPSSEPQARPADNNPGHLLQHQGGRAIASKRQQAHARVAHCNGCLTGAVAAAPSVGEPAHHPSDQTGFYGFGQTLKPAVCEKCRNPKSSDNAAPARHQRMIAGLCL